MLKRTLILTCAAVGLCAGVSAPAAAESDARKALAYEVVERNADQIALVGDSLYYFGELGMQETESARFLKQTLEAAGFTVETGGAGTPANNLAPLGSRQPCGPVGPQTA